MSVATEGGPHRQRRLAAGYRHVGAGFSRPSLLHQHDMRDGELA
jgi:hypothetical protein